MQKKLNTVCLKEKKIKKFTLFMNIHSLAHIHLETRIRVGTMEVMTS